MEEEAKFKLVDIPLDEIPESGSKRGLHNPWLEVVRCFVESGKESVEVTRLVDGTPVTKRNVSKGVSSFNSARKRMSTETGEEVKAKAIQRSGRMFIVKEQ